MKSAQFWIDTLGLTAHPEGGYYREVYRSQEEIPASVLKGRYSGGRPLVTSIFYLLEGSGSSRLHRLKSDEIWHFCEGSALSVHRIQSDGTYSVTKLGRNPDQGEQLLTVVPRGTWLGAMIDKSEGCSLVSCTVAPGFDYEDFELASRTDLLREYPQHRGIIERLT
jgi:uncharacterized protein